MGRSVAVNEERNRIRKPDTTHGGVKNVLRIAQFLALCICSFESGQVFTGQRVPRRDELKVTYREKIQ